MLEPRGQLGERIEARDEFDSRHQENRMTEALRRWGVGQHLRTSIQECSSLPMKVGQSRFYRVGRLEHRVQVSEEPTPLENDFDISPRTVGQAADCRQSPPLVILDRKGLRERAHARAAAMPITVAGDNRTIARAASSSIASVMKRA